MVNHFRTLLLNAAPQSVDAAYEFIPPEYQVLVFPDWMTRIHQTLFPPGLSADQRNFRLLMLLTLVHQPDMYIYTLMFDSRTTYSLNDNDFKRVRTNSVTVTPLFKTTTELQVVHFSDQDARTLGVAPGVHTWLVENAGVGGASVVETRDNVKVGRTVAFSSGYSTPLTLVPAYLLYRFKDATNTLSQPFRYRIALAVPPELNLNELLEQFDHQDMGTSLTSQVFTPWDACKEQLVALRTIWNSSSEPLQRMAAFLQAFVIQAERIRVRGRPWVKPSSVQRVSA